VEKNKSEIVEKGKKLIGANSQGKRLFYPHSFYSKGTKVKEIQEKIGRPIEVKKDYTLMSTKTSFPFRGLRKELLKDDQQVGKSIKHRGDTYSAVWDEHWT
jgi:hypothetical protein